MAPIRSSLSRLSVHFWSRWGTARRASCHDCLGWRQQSGDGGLDGKIDRDELGISQIYVQAKRYAEDIVVGRPTVQSFVGALATRGATVGVFFTTSRFSAEATDAAQRVPQDIALVDGLKLTELMIKHRVGVQVARRIEIVKIDEDFFSDD